MSEWVIIKLFNAKEQLSAISWWEHVTFWWDDDDDMMMSTLYWTNMQNWIFIVLAHWNNSPRVTQGEHATHYTTDVVLTQGEHATHYTTDVVLTQGEHATHYTTEVVQNWDEEPRIHQWIMIILISLEAF